MARQKSLRHRSLVTLRSRPLKDGRLSLYFDIRHEGVRTTEYLSIYLDGSGADRERQAIAETLRAQREVELLSRGSAYVPTHRRQQSVYGYACAVVRERIGDTESDQKARRSMWRPMLQHLKDYDERMTLRGVTAPWCNGFARHLRAAVGANTAQQYFNRFRSIIRQAMRQGFVAAYLLEDVTTIAGEDVEHIWLTVDELRALQGVETGAPQTLRAFLFCCYCGLRASDVRSLTWGRIGPHGISLRQQKTSNVQYLPLSRQARLLLPQRNDAPDAARVFDLPSHTAMNEALRRMGERLKWSKRLSMHVARHSFAVAYMSHGGDLYCLMKLMGHADIKSTQVYANIVNRRLYEGVELLPPLAEDPLTESCHDKSPNDQS